MSHPKPLTIGAVALSSLLLQLPFLRRGLSLHDEGSILAIARALHEGEVLYRDRVTTIGPLTFELLGWVFDAVGPSFLAARILMIVVFSACTLLAFLILCRFVSQRSALLACCAILATKPLAFRVWTMLSYSQVAILLALAACLLALRFFDGKRPAWLLASGLLAGLTVLCKINFGGALGLSLGLAVAIDWLREPGGFGVLVRRGLALAIGAALPLAAATALYASVDAGSGFFDQSVVRVATQMTDSYRLPMPGLALWAGDVGRNAFTYFPAPLFNLAWDGTLDFSSLPLVVSIESFVKLAYYLPIAILAFGLGSLVRHRASLEPRLWTGRLLVLLLGSSFYMSMVYRPDWSHLASIYPLLILASAAALMRPEADNRWAARTGALLCGVWVMAGLAMTVAVFAAFGTRVDTRMGPIWTTPSRAEEARRALAFLDAQPESSEIPVLRGEPMYYFLTGRTIPSPYDLLLPGLMQADDDQRFARSLASADRILYNPQRASIIPSQLGEYAPVTAAALADGFRVDEVLSPSAVVLSRRPEPAPETIVDVWSQVPETGPIRKEHWAFYRVIRPRDGPSRRQCFGVRHSPAAGEEAMALPLFSPDAWDDAPGPPVQFEIIVQSDSTTTTLSQVAHTPGMPREFMRAPLGDFSGDSVVVRFCVTASADRPEAAFGEPRIVRSRPLPGG